MRRPIVLSTMSIAALLICGVMLAGCGAMGGREEASKPKPELTTVAGDGGSKLGDGGPATKAGLCGPTDVTLDAEGNMYISDTGEYCSGPGGDTVRKVDPHGTITTVAGIGEPGFSGDGGPATKARLDFPNAVAVDREGNLYISDGLNYRIRKVDNDGIITTFAGTGEEGYSGDGGPATSAKLTEPDQMTFDDRGNLYFVDYTSVRKIDPSGTITTVAGTGQAGFSGDGGPATEAKFEANALALDRKGNMYIADTENNRIRKVDRDGTITTVAGTGKMGFNREKGPATKVWLNQPWDVYFDDDSGVLYIADAFNSRIRAVSWGGT